jgi:murein L,D-transpeptidase YcbB/YkuD
MSHGCVRVQRWDSLARYLTVSDTLKHHPDSIGQWIGRGEKKVVVLRERVPIYFRYFTVLAEEDQLRFLEDIYGEDKILRDKYLRGKG